MLLKTPWMLKIKYDDKMYRLLLSLPDIYRVIMLARLVIFHWKLKTATCEICVHFVSPILTQLKRMILSFSLHPHRHTCIYVYIKYITPFPTKNMCTLFHG